MDIIFLRDFRLDLIIGIYEWERKVPQTIQIDIEIGLPSSRAGASDKVEDTIDYGKVVQRIRDSLLEQHFSLVEALAEHIAHLIQQGFNAPWVKISVTKLGLIRGVKLVGVTIERGEKIA